MAFNGLDYVMPDASRQVALSEIRRVLKVGGVFIFSSHNPRAIWQRPSWNAQRIDTVAKRIAGERGLAVKMVRSLLTVARITFADMTSIAKSFRTVCRALAHNAFWEGEGYMNDAAHGGLVTHYAVPCKVEEEVRPAGFKLLEILGDDHPLRSHVFVTPWYYYVFEKSGLAAEGCETTACK